MSWFHHTAFESTSMSGMSMVSHNHKKKQCYISMTTLCYAGSVSSLRGFTHHRSRWYPNFKFYSDTNTPDCKFCLYNHTGPREQHSTLSSLLYPTVLSKFFQNFHFPWSYCSLLTWQQPPFLFFTPQSSGKGREILLSLYRFSFLKDIANDHFCFCFFSILTKTSKHQNKRDIVPPSLLPCL